MPTTPDVTPPDYPTDRLIYSWDEEAGDWAAVDFRDE
jgi:hypothetical protein